MIDIRNAAIVGLAICAALAWGGALVERSKRLEAVTALASYRAEAAEAARRAEAEQRAEEGRRTAAMGRVVEDAQRNINRARSDAAAARAAGVGLRDELARARARSCAAGGDSAASEGGAAADATEALLANVQLRLDRAAEELAGFADESRAAGLACERAYGALTQ